MKIKRNDQQDFGSPGGIFAETRGGNAIFPIQFLSSGALHGL